MPGFFESLFETDFTPHVYTPRGVPDDPWLQVAIDLAIAAAHFAIVLVVLQMLWKRRDLLFRKVSLLFALFMGYRGLTQVLAIWMIWHPGYQLSGIVRVGTTVLSVATAVVLIWLLPVLHRIPSAADLEREVEERNRVKKGAQELELKYQVLMDSAPDAIVMSTPSGRIVYVNRRMEDIFGFPRAELLGKSVDLLIPERLREERARARPSYFESHVQLEIGKAGQYLCARSDGSEFPIEASITPLETSDGPVILASIRDVTERRKAEQRFRGLLESAPDAMVIANASGMIELANLQTERLFGYAREEIIGMPVEMLVPASLREAHGGHRARFFEAPKQRAMGAGFDLMAERKDGTQFPVEISLSPLEGPDGISVTAAIRDITERRRAAELLTEKVAELRHSNEALEQFAHIASHDLQEPLRMVASYTQLLAKRYKGRLDADADEFIGFAVDGTQRMKQLIEDLLLYSRAGKGGPKLIEFSSGGALREALDNLHEAIEESQASVTFDPLPTLVFVESQMVQIFQNLVGNAIKYRAGRVPSIHISAVSTEGEWVFSVVDNGIGIDPKYFERIFLIFQRLHGREEYEGTGIGLAICKRILHQSGGRIWVESEPGQGSTFRFALPVR